MKYSVMFIVFNEEEKLESCLQQFKNRTDDIVVFDTESRDSTFDIAKKYTDKLMKVPFVGYCDCYKESAMLRAKYDWVFHAAPDERYGSAMLDWIDTFDPTGYDVISFNRLNILEGVEQPFEPSAHIRLFRKGGPYLCDLFDCEIFDEKKHYRSTHRIIHKKSNKDIIRGMENRILAGKTVDFKYRFTSMEPYASMVKAYQQQSIKFDEEIKRLISKGNI